MQFIDRQDAAKQLTKKLKSYSKNCVVYALPRGGVMIGAEIAKSLKVPLDLILVSKIGHRLQPEYAICAVAEGCDPVCNELEKKAVDPDWFKQALKSEQAKNRKRREMYFDRNYKTPNPAGKTVIIVDDGMATGLTMRAAVEALSSRKPKKIIVAVPVAPVDAITNLSKLADKVIVLDHPENFLGAVGAHYQNFPQIEDSEVVQLLKEVNKE